jgi:hypothetical protein
MSTLLDEVRETLGLRPVGSPLQRGNPARPAAVSAPGLSGLARAGGYPAEVLNCGTRRFLGIATAVSGIVALTHQLLARALAGAHGAGALGAAHAVLSWPLPLAQPIVAGVAAFVLCVIGVQARGWRRVTPQQGWYLLVFTLAAVMGAGPMVLLCALAVAVFALTILMGLMIFLGLLALLIVRR